MLNKIGQFVTLSVTALTLIIVILFISQQPSGKTVAKEEDVKKEIAQLEKKINERLAGIGNVKGIDTLHEQYKKIQTDTKSLQTKLGELQTLVDDLKTNQKNNKPSKNTEKEKPNKPEKIESDKVVAKDNHINIRSNPTLQGNVLYVLQKGEKLEVLEKTIIEKDGYRWVKVGLQNGQTGYVVRDYVE